MAKVKTSDLTGAALNWAVAKAQGDTPAIRPHVNSKGATIYRSAGMQNSGIDYRPSTDWSHGGPIIERMFKQGLRLHTAEYMTGIHNKELLVASLDSPSGFWFGPTPLVAAMRCHVASKLGNEVDVPDELL